MRSNFFYQKFLLVDIILRLIFFLVGSYELSCFNGVIILIAGLRGVRDVLCFTEPFCFSGGLYGCLRPLKGWVKPTPKKKVEKR